MTISLPSSAKGSGKWSTVGRGILKKWRRLFGVCGLTPAMKYLTCPGKAGIISEKFEQ
jgi:hypothetical protein